MKNTTPPVQPQRTYYGIYSAKQAALCGTIIYRDSDGKEFECSAVCDDPEAKCYRYHFDDNVLLGAVGTFDRIGIPRTENTFEWLWAPSERLIEENTFEWIY